MTELYHDAPEQSMKKCSTCLKEKPLTDFYRESRRKDGHKSICKACCDASTRGDLVTGRLTQLPLSFEVRICADCLVEKPLHEFGSDQRRCKVCQNVRYRNSPVGQQRAAKQKALIAQEGRRVCRTCLEEKPLHEFCRCARSKDGYGTRCTKCNRYRNNVLQREKNRAREQKRYQERKEEIKAKNRENWAKNSARYKETGREWTKRNRNKCNEIIRRYKSRKKGATVDVVDYDLILQQYGRHCHICDKPIEGHQKLHFDHVIPLNRGGKHSQDNIKPSHNVCNTRKKDKLLSEMTPYQRRGVS